MGSGICSTIIQKFVTEISTLLYQQIQVEGYFCSMSLIVGILC